MCCPNITDADVINTFLSGTTNKTLVHKLGWKSPWTTNERLDITPSHASNEDAVGSIVDCSKGIRSGTRARSWPLPSEKGKRAPIEGTPDHFEKKLEGPFLNYAYPV
jgi:hypothetical protein